MNPSASRFLSLAIVLIAIVNLMPAARAYVYLVPDTEHPDQKGHCYDKELKITVPMDEIRQRPGRCETMRCTKDYYLSVAGCGVIAAGPGFAITPMNFSKPYPECCPQLVMSAENLV